MKLSKEQFKQELSKISEVQSVSKTSSYRSIKLKGRYVEFIRKGKSDDEVEKIDFEELYKLYCVSGDCRPTTTLAREYITGRMYSPSVAILAKIME